MRRPIAFLALLAGLGACAPPQRTAEAGGSAVLPARAAAFLYRQCSRAAPPPGEGWWPPDTEDLARFEAALPAAVASDPEGRALDLAGFATGYRRQYAGTVRGGRRFIYGNFYPALLEYPDLDWRREPAIVCDGGPSLFGAEFDVERGTITHLAFNGRG